jgi:hypothetical protein
MPGSHGSEVISAINFVRNPARREENSGRENARYNDDLLSPCGMEERAEIHSAAGIRAAPTYAFAAAARGGIGSRSIV